MSLQNRLRERIRPWHAVIFTVFVVGTVWSLRGEPIESLSVLMAVASGLLGAIVFQFTVGSIWGYVVEYHNAGGRWTDTPLLTPFAVAVAVGAVVYTTLTAELAVAAWGAFWAFAIAAGLVAVVTQFYAGYRSPQD
ncbi:hypothetical protein C440_10658 [Haloferax mucosum ATCC BAA-1512]|uniref:Uncharacterized protein n=1 Tax=Haloferax mucosum ATCC BAA-1512 TaxID=662479 RepID=M0IBB4_9EURY|nr:hypothetical protein [Haloferax mucosum]ELZ94075.1 hypothetical protein C440_10658 [Haloferax mucosum ATCC BAA-1512]